MVSFIKYFRKSCRDLNFIFKKELKSCLRDSGVLIFFILVPLAYPLLYAFIYNNEVLREVPVAVVDESRTTASRRYVRIVGAPPPPPTCAW